METVTKTIELPFEVNEELEILAKERGQDVQSFMTEIVKGITQRERLKKSKKVVNPLVLEARNAINKRRGRRKKYDLVSMVGAGKHCRSFETSEEVDLYIRELRNEWKH